MTASSILGTARYFGAPSRPLAYRCGGAADGTPIVCVHGLLDHSASFEPLAAALWARGMTALRWVAPDCRGHGESAWTPQDYWFPNYLADLEALLDHLALDSSITLVGHSMGGQIASLYAGLRPTRIARLILLDSLNVPDAAPERAPDRYRAWLNARCKTPAPRIYQDTDRLAARLGRRYPELDHATLHTLARQWSRPAEGGGRRLRADPAHLTRNAYGFRLAEAMAIWRQVEAPTLMIEGGRSAARQRVDEHAMAERRACFADHQHVTLDGLGHLLHWQAPARVAETIQRFIAV